MSIKDDYSKVRISRQSNTKIKKVYIIDYSTSLMMIVKTILLIVISCVIAIFAFTIVTKNKKEIKEMFIDNADKAYEDTISSITQTYYLRPPLPFEIKTFRKMMDHPNDVEKVIGEVKKNKEYLDIQNATMKSRSDEVQVPNIPIRDDEYSIIDLRVDQVDVSKKTELYRGVIGVYDKTLARMPTMKELNYYTSRLITDKKFNLNRLQTVLESSREYSILQKNQNNLVYSELPMNATNAQIEFEVQEIYKSATGLDKTYDKNGDNGEKLMSEELFSFLKHKYKEYELNETRLHDLILLILDLDNQNVNMDKIIYYEPDLVKDERRKIISSPLDKVAVTNNGMIYDTFVNQEEIAMLREKKYAEEEKEQKRIELEKYKDYSHEYFSSAENYADVPQDVLPSINNQANGSGPVLGPSTTALVTTREQGECPFKENVNKTPSVPDVPKSEQRRVKKNICLNDPFLEIHRDTKELYDKQRNGFAYLQNERNMSELTDTCERQTKFLNVKDDMFPTFEWPLPPINHPVVCDQNETCIYQPILPQTPLIGTLLDEAFRVVSF